MCARLFRQHNLASRQRDECVAGHTGRIDHRRVAMAPDDSVLQCRSLDVGKGKSLPYSQFKLEVYDAVWQNRQ
jgi:hypothetical protein